MIKLRYYSLILLLTTTLLCHAQKQRIGYVDTEYILENIPEYVEAQDKLNSLSKKWWAEVAIEEEKLEKLIQNLNIDKVLLTKDMLEERELEIDTAKKNIENLKRKKFGPEGELIAKRQQLVKPIQDRIWNVVRQIVKDKKIDFMFDKSSQLLMLYANKKYDYSDLILKKLEK